jgi:uncharacterized protein
MEKPAFFEQQKTCPICETKFNVTRVRSSAIIVINRDTDLKVKYKDVNPTFYSIWVCPTCQFAASDTSFEEEINRKEKEPLTRGLSLLKSQEPDFSGTRTPEIALRSYELAIRTCQIRHQSMGVQSGLFLRAAWICRDLGKQDIEKNYIDKAREYYKLSFETERQQKMSEPTLLYLIGELHRRSGMYKEAIQWFSRAVSHKAIKMEAEIERMARDQWEMSRQQFKEQGNTDAEIEDLGSPPDETVNTAKDKKASPPPTSVTKTATKSTLTRNRSKMFVTLYNDQIEWVAKFVNKSYEQTKVLVEKETVIRGILDAVMALDIELKPFKNEEELIEQLTKILKKA